MLGKHFSGRLKYGPVLSPMVDTGDKGPNTYWVHGENIEITVNM